MKEWIVALCTIIGTPLTVGFVMWSVVSGVEGRLTAQIGGVEERLTARVDRLEGRMDDQFFILDEQGKDILQRLARLETLQGVGVDQ